MSLRDTLDSNLARLGGARGRAMFWACRHEGNFGDLIGPWLFEKATGAPPVFITSKRRLFGALLFTAGSILHHIRRPGQAVVWGSGAISRATVFEAPREILAVRGPATAAICERLGYGRPDVFGDPGLLAPRFFRPRVEKRHALGVVAHMVDAENVPPFLKTPETLLISPVQPVERVVEEMLSCEAIVSSSLHGLIVANAYGIPAGWLRLGDRLKGDDVKFEDYLFGLEPKADLEGWRVRADNLTEILAQARRIPVMDPTRAQDRLLERRPF